MEIKTMLDQYANLMAAVDLLTADKKQLIDDVLATVQDDLNAIDAEFDEGIETARQSANALAAEIKTAVITHGASVKGDHVRASYVKPRITWDTKALAGYAAANPEIEAFKKTGDPSVRISFIK